MKCSTACLVLVVGVAAVSLNTADHSQTLPLQSWNYGIVEFHFIDELLAKVY